MSNFDLSKVTLFASFVAVSVMSNVSSFSQVEAAEVRIPSKSLTRCLPWDPCSPEPQNLTGFHQFCSRIHARRNQRGHVASQKMLPQHEFKQLPHCVLIVILLTDGSGRDRPEWGPHIV